VYCSWSWFGAGSIESGSASMVGEARAGTGPGFGGVAGAAGAADTAAGAFRGGMVCEKSLVNKEWCCC
jgi:hypothetical protein